MLKDLIVVPNFFDNPKEIIELAKQQKYYTLNEHPQDKNTIVRWNGYRTENLEDIIDEKYNILIRETITNKIFKEGLPDKTASSVKYWGSEFFHFFTEDCPADNVNVHQDSGLYAGVVYLNDKVLENKSEHGTIIFNKEKESFIMPYEYNTAIFYRSDFFHAPLNGYGSTVNDARLSLCFFIEKLKYDIHRNTL
jgi:hypothetical protein